MIATATQSLKGEDASMSTVLKVNGRSLSVASIMDGHGGNQAAALCCTNLPGRIESAVSSGSSIEEACLRAFALCDEEIREAGTTSGTTATVIVHDHAARRLVCCNVGSSNALLITASEVSRITVDHRLQGNTAEQERVRSAGAIVAYARHPTGGYPSGPLRMWPGGLATGRSIGDADCEDFAICEPAISAHEVPPTGACVVACSDGVWDALSEDAVVSVVRACIAAARANRKPSKQRAAAASSAQAAADRVVAAALRARGPLDDITCVVMLLGLQPDACSLQPTACSLQPDAWSSLAPVVPFGQTMRVGRARSLWARLRRASLAPAAQCCCEYTVKGGQAFSSRPLRDLPLPHERNSHAETEPRTPARSSSAGAGASRQPQLPPSQQQDSPGSARGGPARTRPRSPTLAVTHADSLPMPPGVRLLVYADLGDGSGDGRDMSYLGSGEFCSVFLTRLGGERPPYMHHARTTHACIYICICICIHIRIYISLARSPPGLLLHSSCTPPALLASLSPSLAGDLPPQVSPSRSRCSAPAGSARLRRGAISTSRCT